MLQTSPPSGLIATNATTRHKPGTGNVLRLWHHVLANATNRRSHCHEAPLTRVSAILPRVTTPDVNAAILDAIKAAGYNVDTTAVLKLPDGRLVVHIDVTDARTGESWSVRAPSEYEALVELAEQIGIHLADG